MLNGDQNHQLLDFCCSAFHCCSRLSSLACFLACLTRSSSSASNYDKRIRWINMTSLQTLQYSGVVLADAPQNWQNMTNTLAAYKFGSALPSIGLMCIHLGRLLYGTLWTICSIMQYCQITILCNTHTHTHTHTHTQVYTHSPEQVVQARPPHRAGLSVSPMADS